MRGIAAIHVRSSRRDPLAKSPEPRPGHELGPGCELGPGRARLLAPHSRSLPLLGALLAIALQPLVPTASADQGEAIILRCTHGQSLNGFSQTAYKQALKDLNADTEEYTDCSSLIRQAQLAAAGSRGGGGGSGSSGGPSAPAVVPTAAEQRAITSAGHAHAAPVQVGDQAIHPGVVHVDVASALSSLPTPLLAMLAFLLTCLLLVAGGALRNHVRARGSD
ncbi:MAG TPA: hypothetical protein VGL68_07735 [Solirubrobacteraceae bacterium]|jgi:hypothetical protein